MHAEGISPVDPDNSVDNSDGSELERRTDEVTSGTERPVVPSLVPRAENQESPVTTEMAVQSLPPVKEVAVGIPQEIYSL